MSLVRESSCICLVYLLATGKVFSSKRNDTRIGRNTVSNVISERRKWNTKSIMSSFGDYRKEIFQSFQMARS